MWATQLLQCQPSARAFFLARTNHQKQGRLQAEQEVARTAGLAPEASVWAGDCPSVMALSRRSELGLRALTRRGAASRLQEPQNCCHWPVAEKA